MAGLKAMLEISISKWLTDQVAPIESLFSNDVDDTYRDILERFLMHLVTQHGERGPDDEYGRNISAVELNTMIGSSAKMEIENDQSVTLIVRKA